MYKKLGIAALLIAAVMAFFLVKEVYDLFNTQFKEGIDEAKRIDLMFDILADAAEGITIRFIVLFVVAALGIRLLGAHSIVNRKNKDKTHA